MKKLVIALVFITLIAVGIFVLQKAKESPSTLGESTHQGPYVAKIRSFIPSSCGFTLAWPDTVAEKENLQWEYTEVRQSSQSLKASMLFENVGLVATCSHNTTNLSLEQFAETFDASYTQQNIQKWGKVTVLPLKNPEETIHIAITPRDNNSTNLVIFTLNDTTVSRLKTDLDAILSSLRPQIVLAPLIISDYE